MPGWLQDWWAVIAFVATVALIPFARWVWTVRRRELVTKDELAAQFRQSAEERRREFEELKADIGRGLRPAIDEQEGRLTELERRQSLIEGELRHVPTRQDLELIGQRLSSLEATMKATGAQVERAVDFLMGRSK